MPMAVLWVVALVEMNQLLQGTGSALQQLDAAEGLAAENFLDLSCILPVLQISILTRYQWRTSTMVIYLLFNQICLLVECLRCRFIQEQDLT
jgi:hypothetical protein